MEAAVIICIIVVSASLLVGTTLYAQLQYDLNATRRQDEIRDTLYINLDKLASDSLARLNQIDGELKKITNWTADHNVFINDLIDEQKEQAKLINELTDRKMDKNRVRAMAWKIDEDLPNGVKASHV